MCCLLKQIANSSQGASEWQLGIAVVKNFKQF